MKFAINYSPQAEKLWREGRIQVDLFKCPDWLDLVAQVGAIHDVYVHCALITWRGELDDVDFDLLQRWLDTTETLVINTHFALAQSDFAPASRITPEAVVEKALRVLSPLCERFGAEKIVIENLPYPAPSASWARKPAARDPSDPSCHLRSRKPRRLWLSAGYRPRHSRLRRQRARRRQSLSQRAAGACLARACMSVGILPEPDDEGIRHDHFAMTAADWAMTEWALQQIRAGAWREPETMAFEYGGVGERFAWRSDSAVIAEQAPRLYQLAMSV